MFEKYILLHENFKALQLVRLLRATREQMLAKLQEEDVPLFSRRVKRFFAADLVGGEDDVPFRDFADEPDRVTQIKKIVNALYHLELTSTDLQKINLREIKFDLAGSSKAIAHARRLCSHTLHHAYQALQLISHLDVDLLDLFAEEIGVIEGAAQKAVSIAKQASPMLSDGSPVIHTASFKPYPVARQLGMVTGITLDQLKPQEQAVDFEFLTHLSEGIPEFLQGLTKAIHKVSSSEAQFDERIQSLHRLSAEDIAQELRINEESLMTLRDNATSLLQAFESLQSQSFFLSINALRYVRLARHSYRLTMSIMDNIGHVGSSSQAMILSNLTELKLKVLPALLTYADKLEVECMLIPGTISDPLLDSVSSLYCSIIEHASLVVDFSQHVELPCLDDIKFTSMRREPCYQRIAEINTKLFLTEEAQAAVEKFFAILKKPKYHGKRLVDLPERPTKTLLTKYFRVFKSYADEVDSTMAANILRGLTDIGGETLSRYLPWRQGDEVQAILSLESGLHSHLDKKKASFAFSVSLYEDVLSSISHSALAALTPYDYKTESDVYALNEESALNATEPTELVFDEQHHLTNPECLSANQAQVLYTLYGKQLSKITDVIPNCDRLLLKLHEHRDSFVHDVSSPERAELAHLYMQLQPYTHGLSDCQDADKGIIASFMAEEHMPIRVERVIELISQVKAKLTSEKAALEEKHTNYARIFRLKNEQSSEANRLDSKPERAGYVIKNRQFSRAITALQKKLEDATCLFNDSIQAQLRPALWGVPYPDINYYWQIQGGQDLRHESRTLNLAEFQMDRPSNQALMLKRIYNAVYYLKSASDRFEALHDKSSEWYFTYNFGVGSSALYSAYSLALELYNDPYFKLLAEDLSDDLKQCITHARQLMSPYQPDATAGDEALERPERNEGLLYALNVLNLSPDYLQALSDGVPLSMERAQALRQHSERVDANIQQIIAASDSYFQLFLKTPMMYGILSNVKRKLSELASVSHDVALEKLEEIRDDFFAEISVKIDQWEEKIGLQPGLISGPMKRILDEYFAGLVKPLNIDSTRYVSLMTSQATLDKRLESALRQRDESHRVVFLETEATLNTLQRFLGEVCKDFTIDATSLRRAFNEAYPILVTLQDNFPLSRFPVAKEVEDEEQYLNRLSGRTDIRHIETLTRLGIRYYDEVKQAQQLSVQTLDEKISYLEALKTKQHEDNQCFIARYKQEIFDKYASRFSGQSFGLVYCKEEYTQAIQNNLERAKAEMFREVRSDENIEEAIKRKMLMQVDYFANDQYKCYVHLDAILAIVSSLKNYLNHCDDSGFESPETKRMKEERVRQLEHLAYNQVIPVNDRIEQMKEMVQDRQFERQMLQYQTYDAFTYGWLKQCLSSLLELVTFGLYKPAFKKNHQALQDGVNHAPDATLGTSHLSLFSQKERRYALPTQSTEDQEDSISSNPAAAGG